MTTQCPICQTHFVANTVFCSECGSYLLGGRKLGTEPFDETEIEWQGKRKHLQRKKLDLPANGPLTLHLRIGKTPRMRELEISLERPIRLGRSDPTHNIFPEIDLTSDNGIEYGVSREHACIFRRDSTIEVEDLGSTNGTYLNGQRLAPYVSHPLKQGDQLQMGKLLVEVSPFSTP